MSTVEGADTTPAIRARLDEPLHGYASRWPTEIHALRGALRAVLDLCDLTESLDNRVEVAS